MEQTFLQQLLNEASNMDLPNFILVSLLFYVPFHFSKKAETLFFHLLYSFFGIYMLFTMEDTRIIYDLKMLVGLGLLIPQIRFIIQFTKDTIQTVKMMTANTYYFFVTIYYKIIRFINWVKSTYSMLKTFFTTFSFQKEDYLKQEQSSQRDYNYEQKHQKFYEEPKQEEQKSYTKHEEPKHETKQEHGEFKRFYSESAYTVLGVNAEDDYKTIKKVYRKLVREYHPDLNPDNIKLYTEITQNINNAWEKVERWKK
ncbi:J domain-containing protein [uncultured Arcobacter sp.]|uniref:J domain-containing protein n=1 Tax=uncultured Arcobacter sp. TaxID=165434 RepID=UPI00261C31B8|nr:J domain-containing protein [uncultured Arcobacter sp.]